MDRYRPTIPASLPHPDGEHEIGDAAARVLADIAARTEPEPAALELVRRSLRSRAERLFPSLDADDIVQSTITGLLAHADRIKPGEIERPWGYIVYASRNAAIDAIRARKREREVELTERHEEAGPDAIAALVDREATHAAVVAAMRSLIRAGEELTVRVITVWLDMAEQLGEAPSTRDVAPRAGVSHTTVSKALKRFRAVVAQELE